MKSKFYETRMNILMAIADRQEEIREHRTTLEAFEKLAATLTAETPDELAQPIRDAIQSRTAAVQYIEREIRELNVLLEAYSLKPAA